MRRDVVFGLTLVVVGAVALTAPGRVAALPSAPTSPSSDKRNTQAAELFQQGKYTEAAELYAQLRQESGNAKYSCNLGLCYSRMGYLEPAIETVRHCLDNAVLGAATRADYQALLAKLEAQRSGGAGAEAGATTPPAVDVPPVPLPVPAPAVPAAPAAAPAWPTPPPPVGPAAVPAPAPLPPMAVPPVAAPPAYPSPPAAAAPPAPYYPNPPAAMPSAAVPEARAPAVDRGQRRIPFGSYATGAVGLVSGAMGVALVMNGRAIQQELDATKNTPAADRQLLEDDKSRSSKGATAAFVISGLGLAGSIVWAIVAPSYTKPALAGLPVNLAVGPGAVGVTGQF